MNSVRMHGALNRMVCVINYITNTTKIAVVLVIITTNTSNSTSTYNTSTTCNYYSLTIDNLLFMLFCHYILCHECMDRQNSHMYVVHIYMGFIQACITEVLKGGRHAKKVFLIHASNG